MPKHMLKLLFLLAAFAVAPANAGHRRATFVDHSWTSATCPHERARLEALAKAEAAAKAPTRVTLLDVPASERPLRNVAPGAYFTP